MVQTGYLRLYVITVGEKIKNLNSKVSVFLEHKCDCKYSSHLISVSFGGVSSNKINVSQKLSWP